MKKISIIAGVTLSSVLSVTPSTYAGLYSPVSCSSQSFFSANACDLCYEEKTTLVPEQQLTGLFDTWLGNDLNPPIVYEDEQTMRPTMIPIGGSGTEWNYSAANPRDIWELTPTIPWTLTGSTNRKVITIDKGKTLKFMQQKVGSSITLKKTDKKVGEYIGMMKFPLVYRYIDPNTQKESEGIAHYECVTYKAGIVMTGGIEVVPPKTAIAQEVVAPTPEAKKIIKTAIAEVQPTPKQITATKTGPELWIAAIIALMLAPMIMFMKKRRT